MEREIKIEMEELKTIIILLSEEEDFKLEKAVCNHGFFMMAPNQWIPSQRTLLRPLRIGNNISLTFSISQPSSIRNNSSSNYLLITPHQQHQPVYVSPLQREAIRCQVARMLRLSPRDEKHLQEFHTIHPQAKINGFGRIFRSPTLFEDIVKCILLCNCSWERSLEMAKALCDHQHTLSSYKGSSSMPKKRKHSSSSSSKSSLRGNFPSSEELAGLDEQTLNQHCNLGYRASTILKVARGVENGTIKLDELEHETDFEKLVGKLGVIKGFGPFTVANVIMCIGFYQQIPVDTETIKHLEQVRGMTNLERNDVKVVIEEIYGKYAPYQCLAYWQERVEYYEKRLGKLWELPKSQYYNVSTTNLEKN